MFCTKCGNKLSGTAKFCSRCGMQIQAQQAQQAVENQTENQAENQTENQAENQNATKTYSKPEVPTVQNQARAVSKPSISGVRIAAIVVAMLTVCTSFMTWYTPASGLSSIVNSASSFLGILSSGSVSIPTLEESYNLWMTPDLVSTASTLFEYAGKSNNYFSYLYIPFVLFIVGVVLAVVGIVKTYKRNGGKAALVWANVVFLLAYLLAFNAGDALVAVYRYIYSNDLLLYCTGISIAGIVVSAVSKNPARTHK